MAAKRSTKKVEDKSISNDGWANIITGLGQQSRDKRLSTKFGKVNVLPPETLSSMYMGDGFAARIIDLPARDMTRRWFTVAGDTDNKVASHLEEVGAKLAVIELVRWARLYGGAVIVMGINDGGELTDPVNESRIKSIDFYHVFDKTLVNPTSEYYSDPQEPKYGLPKMYNISPVHGGASFDIHESRILRMVGVALPPRLAVSNNGWGLSILQTSYDSLRNLGTGYGSAAQLMDDFVQTVLTISGLADIIARGDDQLVIKRAQILALSRSIANIIVVDKEEKYDKQTTNVAGLPEMLREFAMALCASTGIPYTLLMGQSPGGLNATGDSDIRFYYDSIAAEQNDNLRHVINPLVKYTMLAKNGPTSGKIIAGWRIDFLPLWQPSEEQIVNMRERQSITDERYISNNVLSPAEVGKSRFGGKQYSIETILTETDRDMISNTPEAEDSEEDKV